MTRRHGYYDAKVDENWILLGRGHVPIPERYRHWTTEVTRMEVRLTESDVLVQSYDEITDTFTKQTS